VRNRFWLIDPGLQRILTSAAAAITFAGALCGSALAYTEKTLHSFCSWSNCGDGQAPNGLLRDASGNFYATTHYGGKNGQGVVFKLILNSDKGRYTDHVLHNFCAKTNCPDGAMPWGDLIMDVDGNLYGTASGGGGWGVGVIFKMTPEANGWKYTILHSFCHETNCTDGSAPASGLSYQGQASGAPWNGSSPLFGSAYLGGMDDNGVDYEFTTDGSSWTYQVIHTFQTSGGPNPLLVDGSGNLFGTATHGGKYGEGLLYKLAAGTWKDTVLHNFCDITYCIDGSTPQGKLLMDAAGNLFGTTTIGGEGSDCTAREGCGVVFERPSGGGYRVVYNFCSQANCTDGTNPQAGVTMDSSGNLLGTTYNGGVNSQGGVAFELTPDGTESVLVSFCPGGEPCSDGQAPYTPLLLDGQGDFFGATYLGGANGDYGTVFELRP
jgi:uncharacterized repeat protein (TIGR03803 family)